MSEASDFLACQGDVTSDVLSKQIPHMRRRATAVTITIGGNDMGFSSIIKACLANFDCPKAVRNHFGPIAREKSTGKLRALAAKLRKTYVAIRRRAPHATVVVVGSPDVVGSHIDGCFGLSDGDLPMLHLAEKRLNDTIHSVVRARGKNFHFVSLSGVFAGHEACTGLPDPWINTPDHLEYYREYFHPNYEGQQAIAAAVKHKLPKLFSQI
jgi:lysophospholipase L1-like esterase